MLKIWGRVNSSNVQKVMWCCGELGLDYQREDAGGQYGRTTDADMIARNPNARVPTIEDDGFVLWESNAIIRYLAAKHSPGGLYPEDLVARADAERWMDWQQTTVLSSITTIFFGLVREPDSVTPAQLEAAIAKSIPIWSILNDRLEGRDWVLGDSFTMADIPLAVVARRWLELVEERPPMPALDAWFDRIRARPPFEAHVASIPMT